MKIAIISDVHSNLEAFLSVLKDMENFKPDIRINLGDLIGYGPDPKKIIGINKKNDFMTIKGNHEAAINEYYPIENWNYSAQRAIKYQRKNLNNKEKDYLLALPRFHVLDDIRFVHGTPKSSFEDYIESDGLFDHQVFDIFEERICFVGHTHDIKVYSDTQENFSKYQSEFSLDPNQRYIINVGSVGQPRDRTPEAKYAIFDTISNGLNIRKIEYDFQKTMKKIIEKGLPKSLATRLQYGY